MTKNKRFDEKLLIIAIIITTLLFMGGVFTGLTISKQKLGTLEERMLDITTDIQNFQLQFLFFDVLGDKAACPLLSATLADINQDSYDVGIRLTNYDPNKELEALEDYTTLKKEYSRLLIGYWLLSNKLGDSCEEGTNTIVYFYSENCVDCDNQGFVLDYLKRKYGNRVLIFALDADLDEPSVQTLKEYYQIEKYPGLIINGKLYPEFSDSKDLEEILKL